MPTIEAGAIETYDLQADEISVMCASHSGEDYHLQTVRQILSKIGLTESDLESGAHLPAHLPSQRVMIQRDQKPTAIHSNCSGKHVGILALCKLKNFPTAGYLNQFHPVQQLIKQTLLEVAEVELSDVDIAVDGCGVPTFALPIWRIGLLFARLATAPVDGTFRQKALAKIRHAMITKPEYMSGTGQFCAKMMRQYPNQIVMKSGAAGVYGLGLGKVGFGLGLGLKVETGAGEPREITILETLRQLSSKSITMPSHLRQEFSDLIGKKSIYNFHQKKVGQTYPVFQLQPITATN